MSLCAQPKCQHYREEDGGDETHIKLETCTRLIVLAANVVVFWSLANAAAEGTLALDRVVTFASAAIGTMTSWAATMQADISAVPRLRSCCASFCPTSGSMAALAIWNSTTQPAKTSSGRQVSSTRQAEGRSCPAAACPSS